MTHTVGAAQPFYWGRSALTSLTAGQVQALANTRSQSTRFGSFAFENQANQYLYLALPQALGPVDSFKLSGLRLSCIEATVVLSIAGVNVNYYVYRSPELTSATDPVLEIDQ